MITLSDETVDMGEIGKEWVEARRVVHEGAFMILKDARGYPYAVAIEHVVRYRRINGLIEADTLERPVKGGPLGRAIYLHDDGAPHLALEVGAKAIEAIQGAFVRRWLEHEKKRERKAVKA